MYIVVFRDIRDNHKGVISWVSFQSKADFDTWFDEKARSCQQVVEEGVSRESAIELCSTPQVIRNWWISRTRADGGMLLIGPPR